MQDVLTVLVQKLPEFQYDADKSFRSWQKTVTRNRWRSLTTAGNFFNQGRFTLGPGSTLTVNGFYQQGTLSGGDAALEFLIGGTPATSQFGRFIATGVADLNRALEVRLVNGFNLAAGDVGEVVETDAQGASSRFLFNDAGQVQMAIEPLGYVRSFAYDAQYRLIEESAGGLTARNRYDSRGNLISRTDPLGQEVRFSYDPALSRLESFRDPRGNLTGYVRDDRGNLLSVFYPDATAEQFTYDAQGLPKNRDDPPRPDVGRHVQRSWAADLPRPHRRHPRRLRLRQPRQPGNRHRQPGDHAAGVPRPAEPRPADQDHLPGRPVPAVHLSERPAYPHGGPGRFYGELPL